MTESGEWHAIALIGALDTKGHEVAYVRDRVAERGHPTIVIDTGVMGDPRIPLGPGDIPASVVAEAAGTSLPALRARADRGEAVAAMARGAEVVLRRLYGERHTVTGQRRISGAMGLGGSAGVTISSRALAALPVGVPKLLISTLPPGGTTTFDGLGDLMMLPSVTDIAGVNRLSRPILTNAAGAIAGAVEAARTVMDTSHDGDCPVVGASMFGNTTRLVEGARALLEAQGFEVVTFHAVGSGGRTMERLAADGFLSGVLDVTTTEWADELCGGVLSAGPSRLDAAGIRGIPQVLAPGCLDMVNFVTMESVPARYREDPARRFYVWNPQVTLMRTNPEECAALGRILAEKANASVGPVEVLFPMRGLSILDSIGERGPEPFWWPDADSALRESLRAHLRSSIPLHEVDANINDDAFIEASVKAMLRVFSASR